MSRETFLRLPEEKQKRFLDAAWEEFTSVSFEKASINKIVMRAKVPRGSFYQYFTDKKDLFLYMLSGMLDYFLQEYREMFMQSQGDIFQTQLACFDRVLLKKETHPMFLLGMKIFEANLMYLTQAVVENKLAYEIWDAVKECVDLSAFEQRDEMVARQAFILSLVVLVLSMTEAVKHTERIDECRKELVSRLQILQYGSLKKQQA